MSLLDDIRAAEARIREHVACEPSRSLVMHPDEFAWRRDRHADSCSSWLVMLRENAQRLCDCGGRPS